MRLLIAGVLLLWCCATSALELFVATGPATWSKCGTNGCWRQPPLPSKWNLDTTAHALGLRAGDVEIAYRDLGRVSVRGIYVLDAAYDSDRAQITDPHADRIDASTWQHTTGISIAYAPRWAWFNVSVSPAIGVLGIHQRQAFVWYDHKGRPTTSGEETSEHRWTPMAGLKVAYALDGVAIGAGVEWFLRPRYVNSLAGGGRDSKVGLRVRLIELRYAF